ncbi:hypothetical protein [Bombilactobacillus thymidiniphilus]|uniref:MacB-like protein n=1 Tax=Bombilactobacillus thymidiniphilus TaxID=2923363 RepID=A0ABY4PCS1_9LACO|nr:hypothetical protein [Bombilactobacillus thymidiniphilus]UQS83555.1 hypothetical protein MOO47_07245 [Bombilactobacillus thymidiniphilus]
MKKTIIINILIACLLVVAGSVVAKNDTRNYHTQMDRGNIQDGALIFPSRSKQSIPQALRSLEKKHLKNYQIYFIQKRNPNLSYVYMSQTISRLPMDSGRYFTESDFRSAIPFAILGQSIYKKAYKPQSQAYYKVNNDYYSVLGSTGLKSTNNLNKHVFISASPQQKNKTKLKNYQIVVDGAILKHPQKLQKLQKVIKAKHSYRSANHINNIQQNWWTRWGIMIFFLLALAIIIIILNLVMQATLFKEQPLLHGQWRNWFKSITLQAVTFGLALILISSQIQIISWKYFTFYLLSVYLVVLLATALQLLFKISQSIKE